MRDQEGGFLSVSGVWRPGMGAFAASEPLRLAVSQRRVPPPTTCPLGRTEGIAIHLDRPEKSGVKERCGCCPACET